MSPGPERERAAPVGAARRFFAAAERGDLSNRARPGARSDAGQPPILTGSADEKTAALGRVDRHGLAPARDDYHRLVLVHADADEQRTGEADVGRPCDEPSHPGDPGAGHPLALDDHTDLRNDDAVLGEEGAGVSPGTTGLTWVLDPIDGTINFAKGSPLCAISLSL